ncbi:phage terminase large subunit-like protein [Rhodoblastus acidophilus]|uniref:DNA-packaging protein n=1 Tax=Rhodoblastus acidophilus TaxID=1074 RepID=UPI002224B6B4|nr:terminase family protein [Rhodoblastus acidophilus]MCW2283362.1 phage terminase large subunit-like protein [Rhodoblastus acidophilus]MCW2332314.1 phage terminase large subunit-like protein [Rhodoblastus acidophilus]
MRPLPTHARELARLTPRERALFFDSLDADELESLKTLWPFWARPEQLIPEGDWVYWLPLAGRGWGKTRVGAETVRQWAREFGMVNLIGATADDVRDVMVEGESGVLASCPRDERPRYVAHRRRLEWPNGAKSLLFSAEEPERLRGKQHQKLWCDEIAAWRYPEAWDQALFGLRLGTKPQAILTTTPRPTKLMRDLLADPLTHSTRHSTFENIGNLAENFLDRVVRKYEGTRLGRQELHAEMLLDVPGALWTRALLEQAQIGYPPPRPEESVQQASRSPHPEEPPQAASRRTRTQLTRIVVAIDPPATSGENADECGMVVAGLDETRNVHILADLSRQGETPLGWATRAVEAFRNFEADCIVAEVNNGGEMIETLLRQIDANIPYRAVRASRGKFARAEPVAALYEQGRVKHCGVFAKLEDQMCAMTPDFDRTRTGYSPDRVDALVWAVTALALSQESGGAVFEFYRTLAGEQSGVG